jgi:hypothetical protein
MIAPREQKVATSKIPDNQRRNEQPFRHRLAHHLAFTKSAQEPNGMKFRCKFRVPKDFTYRALHPKLNFFGFKPGPTKRTPTGDKLSWGCNDGSATQVMLLRWPL